jgi:hypothetical protein
MSPRRTNAMRAFDLIEPETGYRLKAADPTMYDGCRRCQDGEHWSCHGCSCPCSDRRPFSTPEENAAIEAEVARIGAPRIPWVAAPSGIVTDTRTLDRLQRMAAGYFG